MKTLTTSVLVVLASLLVVAGCGGSDEPSSRATASGGSGAGAGSGGTSTGGSSAGGTTATTGGGSGGGAGVAGQGGAGTTECALPESLPELPPFGARRCAGLPVGATWDPTKNGPFVVGVKTLELTDPLRPERKLTTEVWYPADSSAAGGKKASYSFKVSDIANMLGAPIPFDFGQIPVVATDAVIDAPRAPADPATGLVIFSHGFRGTRFQSTFLTVFLASHGYVVVAPDHQGNTMFDGSASAEQSAVDRVQDVAFLTTEMIRREKTAGDFFAGSFDPRRVAWTGHSFGASTVIMAGAMDNREMLVVPLAPAFDDRMSAVYEPASYDLRAALVLFGGTDDGTTPLADQQLAYQRTGAPRYLTTLSKARHMDYTDVCANGLLKLIPQIGEACSVGSLDAQVAVRTLVTAALHRYLRCDEGASAWLDPSFAVALPGGASLEADPAPAVAAGAEPTVLCDVDGTAAVTIEKKDLERSDAPKLHLEIATAADTPAEAATLLFVHGFSTSGKVFGRQTERLAHHFRVATVDLRGHGESGADPSAPSGPDGAPGTSDDPYRLEAFTEDVRDAVEALGGTNLTLVGWSSGGQAVLEAARTAEPGQVRGLVLVDAAPLTVPDFTQHPKYNGGGTLEFAQELRVALMAPVQTADTWRPAVENYFARDPKPALVTELLDLTLSVAAATRLGQVLAPRPDLVDQLGEIKQPTLILHGEQDDALLLESARYLNAQIPGSELRIFQRSGHAPFVEEPERFHRAILDFVASLP